MASKRGKPRTTRESDMAAELMLSLGVRRPALRAPSPSRCCHAPTMLGRTPIASSAAPTVNRNHENTRSYTLTQIVLWLRQGIREEGCVGQKLTRGDCAIALTPAPGALPRADRASLDWFAGEKVQQVFRQVSGGRVALGRILL